MAENIQTTDWLTRGVPKIQLKAEKTAAKMRAWFFRLLKMRETTRETMRETMNDYIPRDSIEFHDGWLRDSKYFREESSFTHINFAYENQIKTIPAADVVDGEKYRMLLRAAKKMHTWIFLNTFDEQKAYDECGLTDEMNVLLGYGGQYELRGGNNG